MNQSFASFLVRLAQLLIPLRGKNKQTKKTKHSNTDMDVDNHGNVQSFETFKSALIY